MLDDPSSTLSIFFHPLGQGPTLIVLSLFIGWLGWVASSLLRPSIRDILAQRVSVPARTGGCPIVTVDLSSGLRMACLVAGPELKMTPEKQPFILFVHGFAHGAWCWAEHWMPYFAKHGISTVAVNLQGTAGTLPPPDWYGNNTMIPVHKHVQDLLDVVNYFSTNNKRPFVLAGHSLGALLLIKVMEHPDFQAMGKSGQLAGLALLCSGSPMGPVSFFKNVFRRGIWRGLRLLYLMLKKAPLNDAAAAHSIFFDDAMPKALVEDYFHQLQRDGVYEVGWTLKDAPVRKGIKCSDGHIRAPWLGPEGLASERILVLGTEKDTIIDPKMTEEVAQFCGQKTIITLPGVCHDLMLDSQKWEHGAEALHRWWHTLH